MMRRGGGGRGAGGGRAGGGGGGGGGGGAPPRRPARSSGGPATFAPSSDAPPQPPKRPSRISVDSFSMLYSLSVPPSSSSWRPKTRRCSSTGTQRLAYILSFTLPTASLADTSRASVPPPSVRTNIWNSSPTPVSWQGEGNRRGEAGGEGNKEEKQREREGAEEEGGATSPIGSKHSAMAMPRATDSVTARDGQGGCHSTNPSERSRAAINEAWPCATSAAANAPAASLIGSHARSTDTA
eukprot:9503844-Pyramimonas_sp.AAC.4